MPGLNKVAKKLNVDCAPALVGFDFHSGWSHPTYDGYVVCKEFEEALVAAWHEVSTLVLGSCVINETNTWNHIMYGSIKNDTSSKCHKIYSLSNNYSINL